MKKSESKNVKKRMIEEANLDEAHHLKGWIQEDIFCLKLKLKRVNALIKKLKTQKK